MLKELVRKSLQIFRWMRDEFPTEWDKMMQADFGKDVCTHWVKLSNALEDGPIRDKELFTAGFQHSDLVTYEGRLTGSRYQLLIVKKCHPIDCDGTMEHRYQIGKLPFDSIETAQTTASEYRGREDILMVKIISVRD